LSHEEESPKNGRNGVLERVVRLIELISSEQNGVGVREAARSTGIDKSAVSRILSQLELSGYVEQSRNRSSYLAGPRLFALAARLVEQDNLWKAAEPFLSSLVDAFNETCYLAVRTDEGLIFRGKVDCSHRIRYVIELGQLFPLTTGAAGTAILTGLSLEESNAILEKGFERYTELSFASVKEYQAQLKKDRKQGYSFSPGRWVKNGSGFASPYFDSTGRCLGSITLSCPSDRLSNLSLDEAGLSVRDAAQGLSRRLGFLGHWQGWPET